MARGVLIRFLRTTAANLAAQAGSNGLVAGEPYLVDNSSLAIGTGTGSYITIGASGATSIDGGSPSSVFTATSVIDGGTA